MFSHFCNIVFLFSFCRHLNHLCADVLKKLLLTFQMYVHFVDFVSCNNSRYSGTCGGVVAQINRMLVVKMAKYSRSSCKQTPSVRENGVCNWSCLLKEQFSYVATSGVWVVQKNTVWLYCCSDGRWHCHGGILKCNRLCMCLKTKINIKADINKFTVTNSNMKEKIQDLEASDVFSFSWRLTRKAWVCLWPPTL